ncbi:MAG: carboxypeptidase regulatory-like domain-containing protein [Acidobacteriota bacterium]|jgi:hypothetical protein
MKWISVFTLLLALGWGAEQMPAAPVTTSLRGTLYDSTGRPLPEAVLELRSADMRAAEAPLLRAMTDSHGSFEFGQLAPGRYAISVRPAGQGAAATTELTIEADDHALVLNLLAGKAGLDLQVQKNAAAGQAQAPGKENVGSQQVAGLPLEQRDSTSLLLLAAGTNTTTGTGANFTQQYSIHGQRGTTAVFALDGADTTDPENGGATISDFNVDAILRIENLSGVMPASIGEGAAGYINVISKSGTNQIHGDVYEFLRNSVFDARNYFDPSPSLISRRIPAFIRNEFGGTNGGPVVIPGLYNGRDRTFYFFDYQGLRQVQGTTQVLSVPTRAERSGLDTTAVPGDTLYVPLNSQIRQLLNIYPLPNNPGGTYGPRTYMAASNVYITNDQFSVRIDHRISAKEELTVRFTWENIIGPTTNPSQTAINPSYAQLFTEGYRSAALHYVRVPSSTLTMVSTVGFIRSTPQYASLNQTQPGMTFANKLFEAINSQAGGFRGLTGNQLQLRQTLAKIHGAHSLEMGVEARFDRNAEINSMNGNGTYSFGGGPAYSPVSIASASGQHNISPGDLLPDTLSAFLTGTPSSYTRTIGGQGFSQGNRVAVNSIHRDSYNFYLLDNWRATPRLIISYGLRYELNSPMRVGDSRAQGALFFAPDGTRLNYPTPGATQQWVVNPDPVWNTDWNGWGPRLSLSWQPRAKTMVHGAAGTTTILQYPWPNVSITNHFPYAVTISPSASPGSPIPFDNSVAPLVPPAIYTPQGALIDPAKSSQWAGNTPIDVVRFERDLAALLPGNVIQPVQGSSTAQNFRNGYLNTYTMGIQQEILGFNVSASYIGLAGVHLQGTSYPNNYAGASPGFAPFALFNAAGQIIGGFSQESLFDNSVHSSYNAGELVIRRAPTDRSVGFSLSYTFAKSLDNAGGFGGGGGGRQNPQNGSAEKARSSLPGPQNLSFNISAKLPFDRWVSHGLVHGLISGWQIMGIGQFRSGTPFTVVSGIQQTGYGSGGVDRPDQIGTPVLSTSRPVRQDYFGMGAANASYFYIPIGVPGGTGPYCGRFGTLGRNTFNGPPLRNFDVALSKEFNLDKRFKLQSRAEFYNVFNMVNFSTPNNVVTGSGFGMITSTASNSRQLQFSLKLVY